jgi:hypothetical protein
MTTVSLAVALLALRGLRHGFLPGERVVLAMTWLLPTAVVWLNTKYLPIGALILLSCFGYFQFRIGQEVKGAAAGYSRNEPGNALASSRS